MVKIQTLSYLRPIQTKQKMEGSPMSIQMWYLDTIFQEVENKLWQANFDELQSLLKCSKAIIAT